MSLTASDFPNQAAYDRYRASQRSNNQTGNAGNTGRTGRGRGGQPVQRVTRIEDVKQSVDTGSTTNTGGTEIESGEMTEYERRLIALEEQRQRREEEAMRFTPRRDARDIIRRVLSEYQLESLTDVIWNRYSSQEVNIEDPDALAFSIREEDAYKKRFAANAARVAKGLPELDPASYIQLEDEYKKVLSSNGMPSGFYDSPDDFRAFIEGDVSVAELQGRIQQGYRLVADADPAVKSKMQELYGVSEGELAAYFIDPDRAKPIMMAADYQRQARAAQIAARAQEQAGIRLTGEMAEDLARRGITAEEAATQFGEIGALGELRQTFAGETSITEQDIVEAQFGIDINAQQELERRKRGRVAAFAGGGQFARTTGDTSGATRLGVGTAQ